MAYVLYGIIYLIYFVALSSQSKIKKQESLERRVITDVVENLTRINNALENLILRYQNFKVQKDSQTNYASIVKMKKQRHKINDKIKKSNKKAIKAIVLYSGEIADKMLNRIEATNLRPAKSKNKKETSKTVIIQIVPQEYKNKRKEIISSSKQNKPQKNVELTEILDSNSDSAWAMEYHHLPSVSRENEIQEIRDYSLGSSDMFSIEKKEVGKMNSNYFKGNQNRFKVYINSWVKATEPPNVWLGIDSKERNSEPEFIKPDRPYFRNSIESNDGKKKPRTKTHDTIEDDKNLLREQHKTLILREAYGEACLKVVVQKCYKAIKKSMKMGCQKHSCKENFRTSFDRNTRTACIQEFDAKSNPNEHHSSIMVVKDPTQELHVKNNTKEMIVKGNNETDPIHVIIGRNHGLSKHKSGFNDITRIGYLAAVCLPQDEHSSSRKGKALRSFNILRNRFERECKEISRKKCENACRLATDKTCDIHKCVTGLKSSIKDICNEQCKTSYGYTSSSKSDKDSDEEGSDDSDDSKNSDDSGTDDSGSDRSGSDGSGSDGSCTECSDDTKSDNGDSDDEDSRHKSSGDSGSKSATPLPAVILELSTISSNLNGKLQADATAELDKTRTGKLEMEKLKKLQELEALQKSETPEQAAVPKLLQKTETPKLSEKTKSKEKPEVEGTKKLESPEQTTALPQKTEKPIILKPPEKTETPKKLKKSKKSKKKNKAKKARRHRKAGGKHYGYGIIEYQPFIKNE